MTRATYEGRQPVQALNIAPADQAPVTAGRCEDCACPAPTITKRLGENVFTATLAPEAEAALATTEVVAAADMIVGSVVLSFALTQPEEVA